MTVPRSRWSVFACAGRRFCPAPLPAEDGDLRFPSRGGRSGLVDPRRRHRGGGGRKRRADRRRGAVPVTHCGLGRTFPESV